VFAQLLTSVRHTTTALSLAFKPPITVPATIAQLDKLSDQLGRLISCVVAAASGEPWNLSALVDEWRDGVLAISTEVDRYLEVLEKSVTAGPSDSSYLMHTGMVWEEIDRVEKGLSANELQAVVKRWEGEKDVVKDAWTEFKEFLENDDVNELDDDDDEDGEWGELQWAMSGGKLTVEGKARAEAVCHRSNSLTTGETAAGTSAYPPCDITPISPHSLTRNDISAAPRCVIRIRGRF
jgi:hypothetical protein